MSIALILLLSTVGIAVLMAMWAMWVYNHFVWLKARVDEAWSGIDVQLKRRYDLVPNLIAVVKQYSVHEKSIFDNIAQARAASVGAETVAERGAAEAQLTTTLKTLFAVVENYPDLKADQQFMNLQKQLAELEGELQLARRYYNGSSREYNAAIAVIPAKFVAMFTGFMPVSYFEADAASKEAPKVSF